MYAKVNGTNIFFDVDGKQYVLNEDGTKLCEKPVCFVLHGGPGLDHTHYLPVFDRLAEYMQLVYIDYRGNGRSERTNPSEYTMAQNTEDLEALRQYLGLGKIVVLGQSYGGMMCQKYAITYPDSIRGMILLSTAASAKLFETHADVLRSSGTPEQLEMYEKYFKPGKFPDNETYAKYYRVLADKYNVDLKTQEEWKTHFDRIILSYEAANACFANEAYSFDFTPDLHKVKCPALVIGAEEDWITPIGCTHEIVAHLPDAKEYVAAASHEVFEDKSIYSVMIEFIKERL